MAAVGAVEAGEASVEIAALDERGNRGGGFWAQTREFLRLVGENLPDGRRTGPARVVADADHLGRGFTLAASACRPMVRSTQFMG